MADLGLRSTPPEPSTREEMLEMALLMYVTAHEHLLVAEGFETEGARRMTRRYRIAREALEWGRDDG